jgi:hypothetical protein
MILSDHVSFTTPNTTTNVVYTTQTSDLWVGLSLAHKLGEHWSLGATVFGMQHSETDVIGVDIEEGTTFGTSLERTSLDALGLSAVVGATYIPTEWLRFGARVQTPFIQVHGSGDTYQITHPLTGASFSENIQGGGGNYGKPFDFSLGTAVSPAPWFTLLADISLQLGLSFTEFPSSTLFNDVTSYKTTPRFTSAPSSRRTRPIPSAWASSTIRTRTAAARATRGTRGRTSSA